MADQQNSDSPLKLKDLKPGTKLSGRVTKIELFGAFLEVGVETGGLVHISRLKKGPVNRVEDILKVGQEVDVWVHRVDVENGRLELTLMQSFNLEWKDIKSGLKKSGEVVRIEQFGAFIDIGAERPGLVHVSEMREGYVSDPSEIVKIGDTVNVSVIDVDRRKRQIRLSMKGEFVEELVEPEEAEEEIPTAMELALRAALDTTDEEDEEPPPLVKKRSDKDGQEELEKIFSRTLEHKLESASSREKPAPPPKEP